MRRASLRPIFLALCLCALRVEAMDRWSALSMLESGNCDGARGRAGELSRFQIKPAEWRRYADRAAPPPTDARTALTVAQKIMAKRCARFERAHGRVPTDFEFYILWNAPAKVDRPPRAVVARARRFCNLVARPDGEGSSSGG
ncbi:MAG: hypothetical protein KGS61_19465 [Verrucomicrobia bacterium]|nr:hypothetical protein [Verrucomicrobiota bacterium]